MKSVFLVIQLILAVALIAFILLQNSKGGLTSGVSGEPYRTKRGAEKIIFTSTIIAGILFFIVSIVNLLIH